MSHLTGNKKIVYNRSSIEYCEEKYACEEEHSKAKYLCDQCKTKQCFSCELYLHRAHQCYVEHDRHILPDVLKSLLCQNDSCSSLNYADIHCVQCGIHYCYLCFNNLHKRLTHKRISLKAAEQINKQIEDIQDSFYSDSIDSSSEESSLPYHSLVMDGFEPATMNIIVNGNRDKHPLPDVAISNSQSLLQLKDALTEDESEPEDFVKSFLLADAREKLLVSNFATFVDKLGCDENSLTKVVSIFGNTGDGKSHTLNHTFFNGNEVFQTSDSPLSCTTGVWAAWDSQHHIIVIDTEGMLGVTANTNQRTRLLLKVLAVSDVVIYRTQADRLHNDMFQFLGDSSQAYDKHFSQELEEAVKRGKLKVSPESLGPSVIIFHETKHTEILCHELENCTAEDALRQRFNEMELSIKAFSALKYVGAHTKNPPTNFRPLLQEIKVLLNNNSSRCPRKPEIIFNVLELLNRKFCGEIEKYAPSMFPDQYFTCPSVCLSCNSRCVKRMNHEQEGSDHHCATRCKYQHQYDNKIFLCKVCYDSGCNEVVVPKTGSSKESTLYSLTMYAVAGSILECKKCGIIYRSRQYWYGNQEPERTAVRTEIRHIWPGGNLMLGGTENAGRRLVDCFLNMKESVVNASAKPTKMVSQWVTDKINPDYWTPNSLIKECFNYDCRISFNDANSFHHCRACGKGFCNDCSAYQRPVPEKGWGECPVRVCNKCFHEPCESEYGQHSDSSHVRARYFGEVIGSTLGVVASAMEYPLDVIRESARPSYWVPDTEILNCINCEHEFSDKLRIHHCRSCGKGVCSVCSSNMIPVPSRGWDQPVRVCDLCFQKPSLQMLTES